MGFKKKSVATVATKVEAKEIANVKEAVKGKNFPSVVGDLAKLQTILNEGFGTLSSALTLRVTDLENIEKAIVLAEQRLKDLGVIELESITLDGLQAEIATTREQWDAELKAHDASIAQRDADLAAFRKRQDDTFNYERDKKRREEHDQWKQEFDAKKRAADLEEENRKRDWALREAALQAAEGELKSLREQAAGFDKAVADKVNAREKVIENSLKQHHNQEIALLKLEHSKEQAISNAKVASLEATIAQLTGQLTAARNDAIEANKRAETTTIKALEAASGKAALQAVQDDRSNRSDSMPGKGSR